jgi:hypothetical protein
VPPIALHPANSALLGGLWPVGAGECLAARNQICAGCTRLWKSEIQFGGIFEGLGRTTPLCHFANYLAELFARYLAYEYPTARWLDVLASRTDAAASRAEREAVAQILGCIG